MAQHALGMQGEGVAAVATEAATETLTLAQMRAAVPQAMPCRERVAGTVNPLIVTELVKRPEVIKGRKRK